MRLTLLQVFLIFALLCGSSLYSQTPQQKAPAIHVVFCWLNEPGDQQAIDELLKSTHTLSKIPGIIEIRAGRPIPSDRPIVDDSFDVAFEFVFQSAEAMHAYLTNPIHRKTTEEVLKPLVKKIQVYDFSQMRFENPTIQ